MGNAFTWRISQPSTGIQTALPSHAKERARQFRTHERWVGEGRVVGGDDEAAPCAGRSPRPRTRTGIYFKGGWTHFADQYRTRPRTVAWGPSSQAGRGSPAGFLSDPREGISGPPPGKAGVDHHGVLGGTQRDAARVRSRWSRADVVDDFSLGRPAGLFAQLVPAAAPCLRGWRLGKNFTSARGEPRFQMSRPSMPRPRRGRGGVDGPPAPAARPGGPNGWRPGPSGERRWAVTSSRLENKRLSLALPKFKAHGPDTPQQGVLVLQGVRTSRRPRPVARYMAPVSMWR